MLGFTLIVLDRQAIGVAWIIQRWQSIDINAFVELGLVPAEFSLVFT
jgi:hypothetical protein